MAEQESGEKEFEASEQRRRKARQDGDIAQSKEVANLAVIIGIFVAALSFEGIIGEKIFSRLTGVFHHVESFSSDSFLSAGAQTKAWVIGAIGYVLLLFATVAAFSLISIVLSRSATLTAKRIKFDAKRISPVSNFKKKYGPQGLVDFLRDAIKMIFAGGLATFFLLGFARTYFSSSSIHVGQIFQVTFSQIFQLIVLFGLFQFVLAVIDLPIQQRLYAKKLRMTREEVKKETKESEGDAQLKQSRRSKATKVTNREMLEKVKTATVVMVNPTHYAVALKWDPVSQRAPVVVAKGIDYLAGTIRDLAKANDVPIYSDPPSARSIYNLVDIDSEIEPVHFAAVAAAIQYIESVQRAYK